MKISPHPAHSHSSSSSYHSSFCHCHSPDIFHNTIIMSSASQAPQPPPTSDAELKGRIKDHSRDGRLSFRNFAEHQMRRELKEDAMEKCNIPIKAFAECGREEGLMVVFRCRDFSRAVNECLTIYNGEEAWQRYKHENAADLENKVIKSPD
jgi:hypothetical protein